MTLIEQAIRGSVFYKGTYVSILLQFLKQIFDLSTYKNHTLNLFGKMISFFNKKYIHEHIHLIIFELVFFLLL